MSAKIENWRDIRELALMSIGTDKGSWWADPNFGSELWLLKREGKIDGNTAGTLSRMLRECLSWLARDGLCENIDVRTERNGKNTIAYEIIFYQPHGKSDIIKEVWSAV